MAKAKTKKKSKIKSKGKPASKKRKNKPAASKLASKPALSIPFDEAPMEERLSDAEPQPVFFEEVGDSLVPVSKTPGEAKVPRDIKQD